VTVALSNHVLGGLADSISAPFVLLPQSGLSICHHLIPLDWMMGRQTVAHNLD